MSNPIVPPFAERLQEDYRDLHIGVCNLEVYADDLAKERFGITADNEKAAMRICEKTSKHDSALSRTLKDLNDCHAAATVLYDYPEYAPRARFCVETSLQSAEFVSCAGEFAAKLSESLRGLRERAQKQDDGQWSMRKESVFWNDHNKLHNIAKVYTVGPTLPSCPTDMSSSSTGTDVLLQDYLIELELIPGHVRRILGCLEMIAVAMAHRYYYNMTWYSEVPPQ